MDTLFALAQANPLAAMIALTAIVGCALRAL
jgi:hypothetical protein